MKCNDVRKYFNAFLDDELDVEKNIVVLAHVDMCYECGKKIEVERVLQERIQETVCKVTAPEYLRESILKAAEKSPNIFITLIRNAISGRRVVSLAGAVLAMVIIVCFLVIPRSLKTNDIIELAESKYHHYMAQEADLDIRSQDSKVIEEYIRKQTDMNIVLPNMEDGVQVIGAMLSEVGGVKVSQIFYMYDKNPVSLMIVCSSDSRSESNKGVNFSKMKKVFKDGEIVYYDDEGYCGHCRIVGWNDAGSQYVIVSMLKSDEILKMLKKV